jgi:hypothetical protein
LKKQTNIILFISLIISLLSCEKKPVECIDLAEKFTPSTENKTIKWSKFPAFSLPFKIIYSGPRAYQNQQEPLQHGFSHLEKASMLDANTLPLKNRALLWYGVAFPDANQPWEVLKSPFGNNKVLYQNHWVNSLNNYANIYPDSRNQKTPNVDLFAFDIERQLKSNDSILRVRDFASTPANLKSQSNTEFVLSYKKELQLLYNEPVNIFKNTRKNAGLQFGSYGDAPILNTFANISGNSWKDWISNPKLLNYINTDFSTNQLGGSFFENQDVVMPSAYFYNDYPNPLAEDYLAYMLFQVEVNRAWTKKDIIPFVWLRYSGGLESKGTEFKFIQPFMAEASAIFPLMAGAKGLWLWENPTIFDRNENLATYEYFINGLYRLSKYKEMFEGNPIFVAETNPRDLIDKRIPVWRGVVNGNSILVAASNPYAQPNAETKLKVKYNSWSKTLLLKGREVYLCKFEM